MKSTVPKNERTIAYVRREHDKCMGQFFDNVSYLMKVYNLTWVVMSSDSKLLGYTLHRSTLYRFRSGIWGVATLRYMLYYEHYFKFRFGCPVSVGEMLSFDLSNIQRYSKEVLVK